MNSFCAWYSLRCRSQRATQARSRHTVRFALATNIAKITAADRDRHRRRDRAEVDVR